MQGKRNVFDSVGSLNPGRSVFDLSYSYKFTCDMGQLIPIMCDEVVPGDVFKIGNEVVVRFAPLVAPIMHSINAYIHYFFVPYRLLWSDWEDFITGGRLGDNASVLPRWSSGAGGMAIGTLWDYFGFPTGVELLSTDAPIRFPMNAYNFIWNEYYRDQNLEAEIDIGSNGAIKRRKWAKDYFTSALPWQQRGTAPALPISGTTSAVWAAGAFTNAAPENNFGFKSADATTPVARTNAANALTNAMNFFNANTVNLGAATTFNVSDLRLAFQIQKWLERNARAGARYTEFLKAHYGVAPRDERLQRPEYIGGSKSPVIVSEVLQTGSTDGTSPQGNMAGHGITVDRNFVASYHAKEFGLIMGIMSVMPEADYSQGVNRQWLRRSRYDFYSPEFADLSEQAIETEEIYATGVLAENRAIWGYQGRYDEMRTKQNMIAGLMRTTYDHWHLGRQFAASPLLNTAFVECVPRKDVFAAPAEPGLIVNVGNKIMAVRPIPAQAEPGLIDHN